MLLDFDLLHYSFFNFFVEIYVLKHQVDNSSLFHVYDIIVRPILIPQLSMWGTTSKNHKKRFFLAKRKVIRPIGGQSFREHSGSVFA